MSELRVWVQKRLFVHIMCLHEVKAGETFDRGLFSQGNTITGCCHHWSHGSLCTTAAGDEEAFFFINAGPVSLLDFTHRPSFTIEEGRIIKTKMCQCTATPSLNIDLSHLTLFSQYIYFNFLGWLETSVGISIDFFSSTHFRLSFSPEDRSEVALRTQTRPECINHSLPSTFRFISRAGLFSCGNCDHARV